VVMSSLARRGITIHSTCCDDIQTTSSTVDSSEASLVKSVIDSDEVALRYESVDALER
jgi:hypothetical protein